MSAEEHLKDTNQEMGEDRPAPEGFTEVEPGSNDEGIERGIRKVTMYSPEFGGQELGSAEDLREVIEREVPGLEEHRNFEKMMGQCVNHFKAIERFGHRERISSAELREFAEEVNEPENTVRAWIVEGTGPLMYPTLERAMTKEEAQEKISKIRERLEGVDSFERLQERLDHPYHDAHTKTQVSYPKDLVSARKYYEFLNEMEKGGTITDVSKRVGIDVKRGYNFLEGQLTRLIRRAIKPTTDFEGSRQEERFRIDTPEKYKESLRRHPVFIDLPNFEELDHEARVYTELMGLKKRGELPDKSMNAFAQEYKVSEHNLSSWLNERKRQTLIRRLEIYDKARERHESKYAPKAFEHRIDPSDVYNHFRHLKDTKEHNTEDLATAIERMYRDSPHESRVQWAELRPYHKSAPGWLRDIASSIVKNREEVERVLNKRMGMDTNPNERIRLGVVNNKLYIRKQDTDEYNWMNIYGNEIVHFRSLAEKRAFVKEARDRLGIQGNRRLSQLMEQITDRENIANLKSYHSACDLINRAGYLRGYSLGLILETNNQRVQDIRLRIERIGMKIEGKYGIENPNFPESQEKIDSMYASMLGAGLSDGHISKANDGFIYAESNRYRVEIFNRQVDQFGDVYRHEYSPVEIRYSPTFGRLLENRGLTKGDKTLQNEGWPDWLKQLSPELLTFYYEALWAEDGCFTVRKNGRAIFEVIRGVVLRDPSKSDYGIVDVATKEHVRLVREEGERKDTELLGVHYILRTGKLKELEHSPDSDIADCAKELRKIVQKNPPKLMEDEQNGLASMGIQTIEYFVRLNYYEKTGRLSARWQYGTRTKEDAMRVAFKCPPDDDVKRRKVEKWMWSESESERRERIQREIGGLKDEL